MIMVSEAVKLRGHNPDREEGMLSFVKGVNGEGANNGIYG